MINKIRSLVIMQALVVFLVVPTLLYANESPEYVLDKFNTSLTGEEAMQYLTGSMKIQFASLNKENQEEFLRLNRMKNYKTQTESANGNLQLVVVSNIEFANRTGSSLEPVIYELVKVGNQWKIQERWSGRIILDLFKRKFSPDQFHTQNSFQINGIKVLMKSAFAYFEREKDNTGITIKFYPFPFQERDIEFLKRNSGTTVKDTVQPTAIASSIEYPESEMTVYLDGKNQIISFCLNGYHFSSGDNPQIIPTYNTCIQSASFMEKFAVTQNDLNLVTKGKMPDDKASWDININLPLLREGIN